LIDKETSQCENARANKVKLFGEIILAHHYLGANGTRQSKGVKNRL